MEQVLSIVYLGGMATPVWTPDGASLVVPADRYGCYGLFRVGAPEGRSPAR